MKPKYEMGSVLKDLIDNIETQWEEDLKQYPPAVQEYMRELRKEFDEKLKEMVLRDEVVPHTSNTFGFGLLGIAKEHPNYVQDSEKQVV